MVTTIQHISSYDIRMTKWTFLKIIDEYKPNQGVQGAKIKRCPEIGFSFGYLTFPNEPSMVTIIQHILLYDIRMTKCTFLEINDKCKPNQGVQGAKIKRSPEIGFSFGYLPFPNEPSIVTIIQHIFSYDIRMTQQTFPNDIDKCKPNQGVQGTKIKR